MKKSYRCNNFNGINLFLADRTELKMNFNQTNLIKTEDYDAMSALGLLTLTNKWAEVAENLITHEAITSTSTTAITTTYTILDVAGVWLATDTLHAGTNYYTAAAGSSFSSKTITLTTALPATNTPVIVTYSSKNIAVGTGADVTYSKTIQNTGGLSYTYKVEVSVPATVTMIVASTLVMTLKSAAGATLETRTQTMPVTAGAATLTYYFTPSSQNLADSVTFSGTLKKGTAYNVSITVTPIAISDCANGATFAAFGAEAVDKIKASIQLVKDGVAVTESNFVTLYLTSDDLGLTPVAVTSIAIAGTGGKGKIINQRLISTDVMGVQAVSDVNGELAIDVEYTTGAGVFYLVCQFADGLRIVSNPMTFAA